MPWVETEPGVYKTPLGGAERIYDRVARLFNHLKREHYRVHCVCRLDFGPDFVQTQGDGQDQGRRDPATALREAWKAVRREMPALGVVLDTGIHTGEKGPAVHKVYKVLDAQGEEDWVLQTFFVESLGTTSDDVLARQPSDLSCLHFLPATSEVVLLLAHWRVDAVGNNLIIDRLFTLMTELPALETVRQPTINDVSPCLEEALGTPETWTNEQDEWARNYIQKFRENSYANDRMRYRGDAETLPGNPVRQTVIFDPACTAPLISACKERDISVTAAVHSALAQTVFSLADIRETNGVTNGVTNGDMNGLTNGHANSTTNGLTNGHGEKKHQSKHDYTCTMAMNLRPKLPAPYNSRAHAAQTYVLGMACRVKRESSFADSAKALTRHYKEMYNNDTLRECLRAVYKNNADTTPAQQKKAASVAAAAASAPPSPPCGITISSLGVVDHSLTGHYGGDDSSGSLVKVREYHFGIDMMTRQMVMYSGTFRGRLQLSISYNDAYYGSDVPLDVIDRVRHELEKGLGVELLLAGPASA